MKLATVPTGAALRRVVSICVAMQNGDRNRFMRLLSHSAGMRAGETASIRTASRVRWQPDLA